MENVSKFDAYHFLKRCIVIVKAVQRMSRSGAAYVS